MAAHASSTVAGLQAEVQKKMINKKRKNKPRDPFPDAPARKRRTLKPTSDRGSCSLVEPTIVDESAVEVFADAEALDTMGMDDFVVGEEVVVSTTSTPHRSPRTPDRQQQHSSISTYEPFGEALDDYLEMSDSDGDLTEQDDFFQDAIPLPSLTGRDARNEPSCSADLSSFQSKVLQIEDRNNDIVIRDIAMDDNSTFDWKQDVATFTGKRETFTGTPGPTVPVTDRTTVLDIFYQMFDTNFIDNICTETNRYADQNLAQIRQGNLSTPFCRLLKWTPTNRDEMISYLAIIILQGLYSVAAEESYFSNNGFGTMPYFSRIMSYNRFRLLKTQLHFVDNKALTDSPDKLWKIKPVIDYFNMKFSSLYKPAQEISIDESLLKWHGKLSFSQKIAAKAARVGIKTYELCESSSGYLWKFFVYVGKNHQTVTETELNHDLETNDDDNDDGHKNENDNDTLTDSSDVRPTNATAKIVYELVEPLLHLGHTLVMDNFYNSPLLSRCLKRQKTDSYGTLRLNRQFVPEAMKTLNKTDLIRGEAIVSYCPDLSVMVWRDANLVGMISTYHSLQMGTQHKNNTVTHKPQIVLDYNKTMGGVDRKDQYLSAQPMERIRNKVWYKKVFQRMFNTALFNCYIIFRTQNPSMTHRQFRKVLAESLLFQHRQIDLTREPRLTFRRETGQPTSTKTKASVQLMTVKKPRPLVRPIVDHDHFPVRTSGKSRFRCWMCAKRKVQSRCVWKCMECNVALCIDGCFRAYHKRDT